MNQSIGDYLADFTVPLSWYLDPPPQLPPPARQVNWDTPFSPVNSGTVYQFVYAGWFDTGIPQHGAVNPQPGWWQDEMRIPWPDTSAAPWPWNLYPWNYLACCAGQAYHIDFQHGNAPGEGWMSCAKQTQYYPNPIVYTFYVFWPRVLGPRPIKRFSGIIPLLTTSVVLLPWLLVLDVNLNVAMSAARRRYRKS